MNKYLTSVCLGLSLCLLPGLSPLASPDNIPGFIVKLRTSDTGQQVYSQSVRQSMGERVRQEINLYSGLNTQYHRMMNNNTHVLTLPQAMSSAEAQSYIEQLSTHPDIEYIEPDRLYYPLTDVNDSYYQSGGQNYLKAFDADTNPTGINVTEAWESSTGSDAIVIAVIDSGIVDHAELNNRLVNGHPETAGYDFVSSIFQAGDGDGRDADPTDDATSNDVALRVTDYSHGTFVASIIGAETNNTSGMAGVDQKAKLLIVRALGRSSGLLSDISDAIRWSAGLPVEGVPNNPNPAHIINLSLGSEAGSGCSITEQLAINEATQQGAIIVAAAGNEGSSDLITPAICQNTIAVGALSTTNDLASFSNYNSKAAITAHSDDDLMMLLAPGSEIVGLAGKDYSSQETSYATSHGTSFSAPIVSGVLGLMLANNTQLTDGSIDRSLVPYIAVTKLMRTTRSFATDSQCAEYEFKCGIGVIDAAAAVTSAAKVSDTEIDQANSSTVSTTNSGGSSGGGGGLMHWLLITLMSGLLLQRRRSRTHIN